MLISVFLGTGVHILAILGAIQTIICLGIMEVMQRG
jgi:hypothetical protein